MAIASVVDELDSAEVDADVDSGDCDLEADSTDGDVDFDFDFADSEVEVELFACVFVLSLFPSSLISVLIEGAEIISLFLSKACFVFDTTPWWAEK